MQLDRIKEKVWNGEVLSDFELGELERAAQREGGPIWRTTVAQALINADAINQAIPILEAVRRDFPGELQAHLALGRALISLEKWTEAEAPLKRALELNPGDPEPTKALATLALRRGEWSRAKAWVDEVMKVDPLDSEARLLQAEIERLAPGELNETPSLEAFTRILVERLKAQSTPHLVSRGQLTIRLGRGGVARFDLTSLFSDATRLGRPLPEAAELLARDFAERSLGIPAGRLQLLAKVLPVVRDSAFLERGEGCSRREGPAGLWFFFAVGDPENALYVPEGLLAAYRITLEQLDEAAWKNLEARHTEVRALELEQGALRISTATTGLWALAHGDGHDAARLLTVSHQAAIERTCGRGPLRVYLGLRELVLFCREDDLVAVKKLEGLDAAREGIVGSWRLHEGRLTSVSEWDLEDE
ncbi:MAG: tetratricopeptide repeat protein [Archangium sp.]|nr:tetratricopeptide repeat protein [Archangium sp.]